MDVPKKRRSDKKVQDLSDHLEHRFRFQGPKLA